MARPLIAHALLFLFFSLLASARPTFIDDYVKDNSKTYLRGVNVGGWLVVEPYLTPELFNGTKAVDQWTFDEQPGSAQSLKNHWDTFFNETDVQKLRSYGINALRIGIGYWAYDNSNTPYHSGADDYLEKAVGWARKAGMAVIIDLHGAPGRQNAAAGSGRIAAVEWQANGQDNLERTTEILRGMAQKYGSAKYADTVVAIELLNEPSNGLPNTLTTSKKWTKKTFEVVREAAANKNLRIVMHDQWVQPKNWLDVNAALNSTNPGIFALDVHQYQIFTDKDRHLDQDGHIKEVCQFAEEQLKLAKDNNLPIYGGEFSGNTFICVNADGSTFADPDGNGQLCKNGGCQCEADGGLSLDDWEDPLVQQVRRYVEAQLDAFEKYAGGKSTLWTLIATLFANRGCRLLLLECTRSGLLGFHGRRRKGESLLPQTREGRTWD
ncbi:glycoside hydrolase superfamily [Phyllosticta capitalensis]